MSSQDKVGRSLPELERLRARVTELEQAIAKLRESEKRLQVVFEASPLVIFAKDLDGRYIMANPAFSQLLDHPVKEILGRRDEDLFSGKEADTLHVGDAQVFETGETLRSVDRLTIAGKVRVFVSTKAPLRDKRGKIIGLSGSATEVTAEVKAHEQLAHLNQVLRAVRSVNQLITKEHDPDRLLQRVCARLIRTRGYRNVWIALLDADTKLLAFYHAGLGEEARSLKETLKIGNLPECARRALTAGGVVKIEDTISECGDCPLVGKAPAHREMTSRLEHDGKVYGLISVGLPREYAGLEEEQALLKELAGDISFALHDLEVEKEQRKAQEALRASEAHYRSIVENSHSGILIVDETYRFVYANKRLCKLLERNCREIIGHDFREFLDEESRALVVDRYRRRQRGEEVPSHYEFNVIRPNGKKRRVEISSTVIRDSMGNVRTIAQLLDITAQRHLERSLDGIYRLQRRLVLLHEERGIVRAVIDAVRDLLEMGDCALYLVNKSEKKLFLAGYTQEVSPKFREMPLENGRGIIPIVAQTGETIYLPDVSQDLRYLPGRIKNRSELCVPIKTKGKVLGVLNAESSELDAFSIDDQRLLETLADSAAVALENARLFSTLQSSEEQFRSVAEAAAEAVIIANPEGKIIFWNKAAQDIFGYRVREVIGRSPVFLMPERFRKAFHAGMENWKTTGVAPLAGERTVFTGLKKDGHEFPCAISYSTWEAGGKRYSSVVIRDITELMRAEKEIKESYARLQRILDGIVRALAAAVELRDPYTSGHQQRVAKLAVAIAKEMKLSSDRIEGLFYACLVHDIGKLAIPAEILAKPSALTDLEFSLIKTHPKRAYDVLKEINFPWPIADIVLQHHERLDGSGYPNGLKDGEILLEARILAVADVVEAMSSHRPYRPALGLEAALSEMEKNRGRLYDPEAVDACLRLFRDKGFTFKT